MKPAGSRLNKVASVIREELGLLLLRDIRDPLVREVTLTDVKVTRDLGIAKIYYLPLSPEPADTPKGRRQRKELERAFQRASGFLRRELGLRLSMRTVPQLRFYWDDAVEHGRRMESIFSELAAEQEQRETSTREGEVDVDAPSEEAP